MITSPRRSRTHDRHFEPDEEDEMRPNARSINEPRESRSIQLEGQKEKMVEEALTQKGRVKFRRKGKLSFEGKEGENAGWYDTYDSIFYDSDM